MKPSDLNKIKSQIFPHLLSNPSDKTSLLNFNSLEKNYFIGIKKNKIVHYFLTYANIINSPLMKTPFNKKLLNNNDAYLGSTFTIPDERGRWITPISISKIIDYYRSETNNKRIIVLVHKNTPGAVEFYNMLGFKVILNAAPTNIFQWLIKKVKIIE